MYRKLGIHLEINGDVSYYFDREEEIKRYTIEYPQHLILFKDENKLNQGGYEKNGKRYGKLILSWKKPFLYELEYKKLSKLSGNRFNERIRTKAQIDSGFYFYLEMDEGILIDLKNSDIKWGEFNFRGGGILRHGNNSISGNSSKNNFLTINPRGMEGVFYETNHLFLNLTIVNK
jgi:hypothetical protein